MNKIKWAICTEFFEKPCFPKLTDALEKNKIEYYNCIFDYEKRTYETVPYDKEDIVILYGPIQFVNKNLNYFPGAFGFKNSTYCSFYMSHIGIKHFFNNDCIFLPFGLITQYKEIFKKLYGDKIFIRPNSGFKSFTGFSVSLEELDFEINALKQTKNIGNDEICLISSEKQIKGEYRFVICDNEVITGSQYRWDGKLDVRIDVNHNCFKYAQEIVAKNTWQLDSCYVVDIFLDKDETPYIGEFNSFSSSGLYNCDMNKIVNAVNKLTLKELNF